MRILAFVNWILLGLGALMALLYAVVCLMMLPYPQLVEQAGGGFDQVMRLTLVLTGFAAVAALSTWTLQKRHSLWPLGQGLLFAALLGVIVFAWTQR